MVSLPDEYHIPDSRCGCAVGTSDMFDPAFFHFRVPYGKTSIDLTVGKNCPIHGLVAHMLYKRVPFDFEVAEDGKSVTLRQKPLKPNPGLPFEIPPGSVAVLLACTCDTWSRVCNTSATTIIKLPKLITDHLREHANYPDLHKVYLAGTREPPFGVVIQVEREIGG